MILALGKAVSDKKSNQDREDLKYLGGAIFNKKMLCKKWRNNSENSWILSRQSMKSLGYQFQMIETWIILSKAFHNGDNFLWNPGQVWSVSTKKISSLYLLNPSQKISSSFYQFKIIQTHILLNTDKWYRKR